MDEPFISIIVPIYKTERYLRECIDSIIRQTDSDWECILVDDGSPDRCGEICDKYAADDARIRVLHKHNEGLSSARLSGMELMRADYFTFLDSDDWIEDNYVETVKHEILGFDLLVFQTCINDEIRCERRNMSFDNGHYHGWDAIQKALVSVHSPNNQLGWTWNKIFRKDILMRSSASFPKEMHFFEDEVFILQYLSCVEHLNLIPDQLHNYRVIHNSLTTSTKSFGELQMVADKIDAELFRFTDQRFLADMYQEVFSYYLFAMNSIESKVGKVKHLQRANTYYKKHKSSLALLGNHRDSRIFGKWFPVTLFYYCFFKYVIS